MEIILLRSIFFLLNQFDMILKLFNNAFFHRRVAVFVESYAITIKGAIFFLGRLQVEGIIWRIKI